MPLRTVNSRALHLLLTHMTVMSLLTLLSGCNYSTTDNLDSAPEPTADTDALHPAPERPEWDERTHMRISRSDFASAVVGNEIWTFGGMRGERGIRLSHSEVYDTVTDTWRTGPELPLALAAFAGASVDDRIYLFGGLDEDAEASDFSAMLDTRTGEWTNPPPLPHRRYGHDVEVVGGKIYVIGGIAAGSYVAKVDIFDPVTNAWSAGVDMIHPRAFISTARVSDAIYVLGGWDESGQTDRVQIYRPAAHTWIEGTPLPQPMSQGGAEAIDGRIWVSLHEFSAVYDPTKDRWSAANPMTVSRHAMSYIGVGSQIYGIGGCTESPLMDVSIVDVLDLQTARASG